MKMILDFKSVPKKRWRIGKNGKKYNPVSKEENALAWKIKAWILENNIQEKLPITYDFFCNISLVGKFYNIKKTKMGWCLVKRAKRGDKDNYEKFVLDAMIKSGVIKDDRQNMGGGLYLNHHETKNLTIIDIQPAKFCCCHDIQVYKNDEAYECLFCKTKYKGEIFCL